MNVFISGLLASSETRPAAIRGATGLNKKEFTARYKIPYRTWQNWELGIAPCPEYILLLLDRAVQADFGE